MTNKIWYLVIMFLAFCNNVECKAQQIFTKEQCDKLVGLAIEEYNLKNYSKAIELGETALSWQEKFIGNNHPDYATTLEVLSSCYSEIKDYKTAIKLRERALSIFAREKETKYYAWSLLTLSSYYSELGDHTNSIKFNKEGLEILGRTIGKDHSEYLLMLTGFLSELGNKGDNIEAIKIGIAEMEELKKIDNEGAKYANFISFFSLFYYNIGNHIEALRLITEALEIQKRTIGNDTPEYALSLSRYALYLEDHPSTVTLFTQALQIQERTIGIEHLDYLTTLNHLASAYAYRKEYNKAIEIEKKVLNFREQQEGKFSGGYTTSLNNLAVYYSYLGNHKESIKLKKESLNILEKVLGKEHPNYITALGNLVFSILKKDNNNRIFNKLYQNLFYLKSKQTKKMLYGLTAYNRSAFIKNEEYYYKRFVPFVSYSKECKEFTDIAYNSTLIYKGVLLDTETELEKLISESKDNESLILLKERKKLEERINILLTNALHNFSSDIDSLRILSENLEYQLIEKSQIYGDFTKNISIDLKQVQNSLQENEMALEFISFPINSDSIMYCALTLKKEYDVPHMIPLFEAKQLSKILPKNYYTSTAISQLVWKPLEKELSGVNNIYFAPDGELYNIAIESLRHFNDKGYLFDKWNFYRVSSTRELVKVRRKKNNPNVVLYGGLDYDANVSDTISHVIDDYSLYTSTRSILDSIGLNRGYGPLTATLPEVLQIDSLYSTVNIPSTLYVGQDGTESSFKQLSGKGISNLHIATHGFYWKESELKNNSDLRNFSFITGDNQPIHIEDKAMTRSGLLFSGANAILSGDTITDCHEDGILTAQEISTLDFRGLDLLVLSACQTGLGEIKGDGVFGLQRGFKKAGAQTIIMSLWNVDDNATQMLMTEFYKNLISGLSKRESFIKAQNAVRNFKGIINGESRDFSNPKYWAAFIMLDGID